jgi:hypothetical protein
MEASLVKGSSPSKIFALGGLDILDSLVSIGNSAKESFDLNLLYNSNFIHDGSICDNNSYAKFILDIVSKSNLSRSISEDVFSRPYGSAYKHRFYDSINRSNLDSLLDKLTLLDKDLFYSTENQDLLGVEYHINFPWGNIPAYFERNAFSSMLEESGFPKRIIPSLTSVYGFKESFFGKKDKDKVISQILGVCNKIDIGNNVVLDGASRPFDLFVYKDNLFYFQRNPTSKDYAHWFCCPNLYWMYALYNGKSNQPIGYSFIGGKDNLIGAESRRELS